MIDPFAVRAPKHNPRCSLRLQEAATHRRNRGRRSLAGHGNQIGRSLLNVPEVANGMNDMMDGMGWMMSGGMGLIGILILAVLVLAIVALVKYLRTGPG